MIRIFAAYAAADRVTVDSILMSLSTQGLAATFVTIEDSNWVTDPIQGHRGRIGEFDALLVFWSKNIASYASLVNEISYLCGYGGVRNRPVITIRIDDTDLPSSLQAYRFIRMDGLSANGVAERIASILLRYESELAKSKEEATARQQVVEKTSEAYVAESIDALKKRENQYQNWATGCYLIGCGVLIAGLAFTLYRMNTGFAVGADAAQSIYLVALSLTVVGFIAAVARFAFVLGRSFMVESLRNHDRIHAIKFGEFYLKCFGEKADWAELKEAFQHWNFDSGSTFKDQKDEVVDPQILKQLIELAKSVKK